jgi:lipoprotein NlpI
MHQRHLSAAIFLVSLTAVAQAETADELLTKARVAWKNGQREEALRLATQAVEAAPQNGKARLARGIYHDGLRKHKEALGDFENVLRLDPNLVEVHHHRGCTHFKLGKIKESLADFDRYLSLRPNEKPGHWQRGITCYYASEYEEGRKQFEGYEKVDANDVENAVWRYLCMAKSAGVEKARSDILKIGKDRRVPMMEVYALFSGNAKPEDVLAAAKAGEPSPAELNERLFYAHLYLGLYHEAQGDKKLAKEHLTQAESHPIDHYMWDVARVHVSRLGG